MTKTHNCTCPLCEKGKLRPQAADYTAWLPGGGQLTVKNVEMDICDFCGEIALGEAAAARVDLEIAEFIESHSTTELTYIRKSFGVTQSQISEILGLGGKTWHRWEKGLQYPSRSMGYYLRVLHQFPEAFEWLKARAWRLTPSNRLNIQKSDHGYLFPSLQSRGQNAETIARTHTENTNAARALFSTR